MDLIHTTVPEHRHVFRSVQLLSVHNPCGVGLCVSRLVYEQDALK